MLPSVEAPVSHMPWGSEKLLSKIYLNCCIFLYGQCVFKQFYGRSGSQTRVYHINLAVIAYVTQVIVC